MTCWDCYPQIILDAIYKNFLLVTLDQVINNMETRNIGKKCLDCPKYHKIVTLYVIEKV
jgi:hypothetical protein